MRSKRSDKRQRRALNKKKIRVPRRKSLQLNRNRRTSCLIKNNREYAPLYESRFRSNPSLSFASSLSFSLFVTSEGTRGASLEPDLSSGLPFAPDNWNCPDNLNRQEKERSRDLDGSLRSLTFVSPSSGPGVAVVQVVEEHRQRQACCGPSIASPSTLGWVLSGPRESWRVERNNGNICGRYIIKRTRVIKSESKHGRQM